MEQLRRLIEKITGKKRNTRGRSAFFSWKKKQSQNFF
jgi:hypothetical protein